MKKIVKIILLTVFLPYRAFGAQAEEPLFSDLLQDLIEQEFEQEKRNRALEGLTEEEQARLKNIWAQKKQYIDAAAQRIESDALNKPVNQ
jgi:hypothetical protein